MQGPSAIGILIENVMSAGVMNTVPLTISSFQFAGRKEEARKIFITIELQNGAGQFFEIGRTGDLSLENDVASVNKTVQVPYQFTELQRVKLNAYKAAEVENSESKELGCAICTLGQILSLRERIVELSNGVGSLQIKTEAVADSRSITLDVSAEKLEKKDLFGKSDPFLQISRKEDNDTWTIVHKTEHIKETLNPHWKEFTLSYHLLCGDDPERDVKFACYDFDKSGNFDLLGEAYFSPSQIMKSSSTQCFALSHAKKKQKKKGYGRLNIKKCKVKKEPSFISNMLAGCQLNLTCAIDFTGSNGDPMQNSSLHYMGSTNPNKYVLSLQAVGRILQEYTSERQIKAYGYGAKVPPDFQVSHDFAIGEKDNGTYCGIDAVIKAYDKTLNKVKLWGPTNFVPIINRVADVAAAGRNSDYHVLLMLTDGVVTDMDETKAAVVRASKLPISIVIVGIGNAEFGGMDIFNKEHKAMKSREGEVAVRKITKYVTFRDFNFASLDVLARNLLENIPFQIMEFYTINEIKTGAETEKDKPEAQIATPEPESQPQEVQKDNKHEAIVNDSSSGGPPSPTTPIQTTETDGAERLGANGAEQISVF